MLHRALSSCVALTLACSSSSWASPPSDEARAIAGAPAQSVERRGKTLTIRPQQGRVLSLRDEAQTEESAGLLYRYLGFDRASALHFIDWQSSESAGTTMLDAKTGWRGALSNSTPLPGGVSPALRWLAGKSTGFDCRNRLELFELPAASRRRANSEAIELESAKLASNQSACPDDDVRQIPLEAHWNSETQLSISWQCTDAQGKHYRNQNQLILTDGRWQEKGAPCPRR